MAITKDRGCKAPSSKDHIKKYKLKLLFLLMNLNGKTLKIHDNQNLIVLMRNLTELVGNADTVDRWKGASII